MKNYSGQSYKVQLRGGFSDRNRLSEISNIIQIDHFDKRTRICIINKMHEIFENINNCYIGNTLKYELWEKLFYDVLKNAYLIETRILDSVFSDDLENYFDNIWENTIKTGTYHDVLTIIEYILKLLVDIFHERVPLSRFSEEKQEFITYYYNERKDMNSLFEKECVGYRFIGEYIVPITDEREKQAIEEALVSEFDGCKIHIDKAVGFLADRETKDYKNCIKESICAVESICKVIVKKESATLGDALGILSKKNGLNPQLKAGFEKLYSYTNDQGGIRHSDGLFESNVTFEEAKYMLVSCCAFVNYLIAEYGKTIEG